MYYINYEMRETNDITTKGNKMRKFTSGQKLSSRSICDHNCIYEGEVINRTAKTVTISTRMYGVNRVKIHIDTDGNEMIFPFGKSSMAAIFRA